MLKETFKPYIYNKFIGKDIDTINYSIIIL